MVYSQRSDKRLAWATLIMVAVTLILAIWLIAGCQWTSQWQVVVLKPAPAADPTMSGNLGGESAPADPATIDIRQEMEDSAQMQMGIPDPLGSSGDSSESPDPPDPTTKPAIPPSPPPPER